jgi:hypothetical protein
MMSKSTRKLKIHPRIVENKGGKYLKPELRLSGKWMLSYGFGINEQVTVVCEPNKLTIVLRDNS